MPNGTILALMVLLVIVVFLLPMKRESNPSDEGFLGITAYDGMATNRDLYIEAGKQKYNKLAGVMDVTTGNFMRSDNPAVIARANAQIKSAMVSSGLVESSKEATVLGIRPDAPTAALPPPSGVYQEAKKCEALRGRDMCSKLGNPEYANCGICLKEGTPYSYQNPGKHIGGMFIMPDDKALAQEIGASRKTAPVYQPTVGSCSPGNFQVLRDICIKEANRMDCKEAGETGGFKGGRTAEGKTGVAAAKCAQAPLAGDNVFVYEPKSNNTSTRGFNVSLRVITPVGTGKTRVIIYNAAKQQVAIGESSTPGKDIVINIPNAKERDKYQVFIAQEVPYRPMGKSEVFQYIDADAGSGYNQSYESSVATCQRIGARIATKSELEDSWRAGAQVCSYGWAKNGNGKYRGFPMKAFEKRGWCGGRSNNGDTLTEWGSNDPSLMAHSWCYGIKPPQSDNRTALKNAVNAFFVTLGEGSEPSQAGMGRKWSQFDDYQAPYYRAVILQWEMSNGSNTRTVNFEPSIIGINGQGPSSTATDGTRTFKVLRRMGSFAKSSTILAPRPGGGSKILTNQFWIWSNQPKSQTVIFDAQVPGIFLDPYYSEDRAIAPRGPLISSDETMKLLRTSPCMKEGQVAGKYSIECLTNLFVGSGGDPYMGKIATTGGGLADLNKLGDMDAISAYLDDLYQMATTGRDGSGNKVGANGKDRARQINDAAQKMFGFDITTPCEEVSEDARGNIVITAKAAPFDSDCLDYLWTNAGSEESRGIDDRGKAIKATYTTIMDRFSGLRKGEGSPAAREKYPFQTCQRTGLLSPLKADGSINPAAVMAANSKGSLRNVQDFYNSIHVAANYASDTEQGAKAKSDAIAQCYGLTKAVDASSRSGCGVVARYVRVLATNIHPSWDKDSLCIQIPQLEVIDVDGNNVSKGKKVRTASPYNFGGTPEAAVDGKAYPHTGAEGAYYDNCEGDNQFWMVDLGAMTEITEVRFHPRTDAYNALRQLAAPVQLLDESMNVVAQKNIGVGGTWPNRWFQRETDYIKFMAKDAMPEIKLSDFTPGATFSLLTAISFDRYLRNVNGAMFAPGPDAGTMNFSDAYKSTATFRITYALNGNPAHVSIQMGNNTNFYLIHRDTRLYAQFAETNAIFKNNASWIIRPSLNGSKAMLSIESANMPGHFIATSRMNPDQIWITKIDTSNAYDTNRACWVIKKPMM
jgi:hypothetical protein